MWCTWIKSIKTQIDMLFTRTNTEIKVQLKVFSICLYSALSTQIRCTLWLNSIQVFLLSEKECQRWGKNSVFFAPTEWMNNDVSGHYWNEIIESSVGSFYAVHHINLECVNGFAWVFPIPHFHWVCFFIIQSWRRKREMD